MHYYRPPNEATLIYLPAQGVVEVCAESPGVRQNVATCFAEAALRHDLSSRPVTLKQYNLSRFLEDLSLPPVAIEGVDVELVSVAEIEVVLSQPRHRLRLRVPAQDRIEAVAEATFGSDHVFRRASAISRVVIAIRYVRPGQRRPKTLNVTLTHPNRCNLRSNRDPLERELGYAMLEAWGILRPIEPLYDPFLGSGTSLIAAETCGRTCLGLELDPAYADVIVTRWQRFTGGTARREDGASFAERAHGRAAA